MTEADVWLRWRGGGSLTPFILRNDLRPLAM